MAVQLSAEGCSIDELCRVCECDMAGRPPLPPHSPETTWLRERADIVQVLKAKPKSLLMGRDLIELGLKPGVEFKAILEGAFQRQIEGGLESKEQAMFFAREWMQKGPPVTKPTVSLFRAEPGPSPKSVTAPRPSWMAEDPISKNTDLAAGRWFTNSREDAEWYLKEEYFDGGHIVGVELPVAEAEKYRVSNLPLKPGGKNTPENPAAFSRRPETEFFLPAELAEQAQPITSVPLPAIPTSPRHTRGLGYSAGEPI